MKSHDDEESDIDCAESAALDFLISSDSSSNTDHNISVERPDLSSVTAANELHETTTRENSKKIEAVSTLEEASNMPNSALSPNPQNADQLSATASQTAILASIAPKQASLANSPSEKRSEKVAIVDREIDRLFKQLIQLTGNQMILKLKLKKKLSDIQRSFEADPKICKLIHNSSKTTTLSQQSSAESLSKQVFKKREFPDENRVSSHYNARNKASFERNSQANHSVIKKQKTLNDETLSPSSKISKTDRHLYRDKITGFHIKNKLVADDAMEQKLQGRKVISLSNLSSSIINNQIIGNWVTFGIVVGISDIRSVAKKNGSTKKLNDGNSSERAIDRHDKFITIRISRLEPASVSGDYDQIMVFLFGDAFERHWKTLNNGLVIGILNADILPPTDKNSMHALKLDNGLKLIHLGQALEYGMCKANRNDGQPCSNAVNRFSYSYCKYHTRSLTQALKLNRPNMKEANPIHALKRNAKRDGVYFVNGSLIASNEPIKHQTRASVNVPSKTEEKALSRFLQMSSVGSRHHKALSENSGTLENSSINPYSRPKSKPVTDLKNALLKKSGGIEIELSDAKSSHSMYESISKLRKTKFSKPSCQ